MNNTLIRSIIKDYNKTIDRINLNKPRGFVFLCIDSGSYSACSYVKLNNPSNNSQFQHFTTHECWIGTEVWWWSGDFKKRDQTSANEQRILFLKALIEQLENML